MSLTHRALPAALRAPRPGSPPHPPSARVTVFGSAEALEDGLWPQVPVCQPAV